MEFDLNKTPPSSQTLAEHRKTYTLQMNTLDVKKKRIKQFSFGFSILALLMFFLLSYFDIVYLIDILGLGMLALTALSPFMVAGAVAYYNVYHIDKPRYELDLYMLHHTELEPSEHPDECVQFLQWCKHDETLKHYQHQLAELDRKPTMYEYILAKRWFEKAEELGKTTAS